MESRQLYQQLYTKTHYGKAAKHHCPGIRLVPMAKDWLIGRVIDLGCGTGDTVFALREAGFNAIGIDQITLDNGMLVGDITAPLDLSTFDSCFSSDVFEHIPLEGAEQVLANMQATQRQLISIHNGPSQWPNEVGELHITRLPFEEWEAVIRKYLNIRWISIKGNHYQVYLCERKKDV